MGAAPVFALPPAVTPGSQNFQFTSNGTLPPGSYGNISVSGNKTLTLAPGTYNINSLTLTGNWPADFDYFVYRERSYGAEPFGEDRI